MRRILINIISLSLGELLARIFNFITFAYLARIILARGFGVINFSAAFVSFFIFLVNYGFETIAVREVSNRPEKLASYLINITVTKFLLGITAYGLLATFTLMTVHDVMYRQAVLIYGASIFSNVFLIGWVFRTVEKTYPITIAQSVSGLLNLIAVLLFIRRPDQLIPIIWIFVISGFINSAILLMFMNRVVDLGRINIDIRLIINIFRKASPVALSLLMILVYYNMDQVMLGYMSTRTEVGYYSASYKLLLVAIIPSGIILNAFFPDLTRGSDKNEVRNHTMRNFSLAMLGTGFYVGIAGIIFAREIITLIYGSAFIPGVPLFSILMINSILIYVNITYGNPLLAWNLEKKYLIAVSAGGISNILLNFLLIPEYHALGAAIATLCSEIVVLIGVVYFHYSITKELYLKNNLYLMIIALITFIIGKSMLYHFQNGLLALLIITVCYVAALFISRIISADKIKRMFSDEI